MCDFAPQEPGSGFVLRTSRHPWFCFCLGYCVGAPGGGGDSCLSAGGWAPGEKDKRAN